MSRLERLVNDAKRRRVFRVAVGYAAVAFVIWQVADFALPAARLPDWTPTLVLVLTILGFPVALVLAWAYDITTAGVVRTGSEAERAGTEGPALFSARFRWCVRHPFATSPVEVAPHPRGRCSEAKSARVRSGRSIGSA